MTVQVPSALAGLTAGFEKGPGVPPPLHTPRNIAWPIPTPDIPPVGFDTRRTGLAQQSASPDGQERAKQVKRSQVTQTAQFCAAERAAVLMRKCWKSPRPLVRVGCGPCGPYTSRLYCRWSACGLTCLCSEGPHLGARFLLRCFQQLSLPEVATEQCRWHDNSHTSAPSSPVLSY